FGSVKFGYLVWTDAYQFIFLEILYGKRKKIIDDPYPLYLGPLWEFLIFLKVVSQEQVDFFQSSIIFGNKQVTESVSVLNLAAHNGIDVFSSTEVHKIPAVRCAVDIGQCQGRNSLFFGHHHQLLRSDCTVS